MASLVNRELVYRAGGQAQCFRLDPRKLLSIRINSLCLSILLLSAKFKHLNSRGETERKLAL